jgi:threonine aldolase
VAKLFGKEASILVPSGTMSNLLAIMLHCREKGDAAIIGDMSHINNWERGHMAAAAGVMPITI